MKNKNLFLFALNFLVFLSLASVGTFAYFNAKKSFTNNTFSAGTLDLDVTSKDGINQAISIDNIGSQPDLSGNKTWTIKNSGSIPGKLIISLNNLQNLENGCNQPELEAEPNCQNDNLGELGQAISLSIIVNGNTLASSTLDNASTLESQIRSQNFTLNPGQSLELTTSWQQSSQGYGNEIQSDTVNFDLSFRLEQ